MPSPGWIRIVIALAAAATLLLSLLLGNGGEDAEMHWFGAVSGAVTLILLGFDRWAWRWPGIRRLSELAGSRVLHGTWRGRFDFTDDGEGHAGGGPIFLAVQQTYSQLAIRCYFPESGSSSRSLTASLRVEEHRHLLRYVYQHESPILDRDRNRPTQGACELAVVGSPVQELSGSYYAERGGKGTLELHEHAAQVAGSAAQAERLSYRSRIR